MLERYFRYILKQRGFADVNQVLYSLGYCQGDGCSFTTTMDLEEIKALLPFVYGGDFKRATDRVNNLISMRKLNHELAAEEDLSVTISQSGNYVHENTMSTDWENSWGDAEANSALYSDLADHIDEYAKDTARDMTQNGYSILEAFNREKNCVWSFSTSQYLFRLIEIEEELEDSFGSDFDEEYFVAIAESMIAGKSKVTCFKAEVFDLTSVDVECIEDENPLGEVYLGGVEYSPEDRTYGGCRRELIGELISMIRDSSKQMQNQAA